MPIRRSTLVAASPGWKTDWIAGSSSKRTSLHGTDEGGERGDQSQQGLSCEAEVGQGKAPVACR